RSGTSCAWWSPPRAWKRPSRPISCAKWAATNCRVTTSAGRRRRARSRPVSRATEAAAGGQCRGAGIILLAHAPSGAAAMRRITARPLCAAAALAPSRALAGRPAVSPAAVAELVARPAGPLLLDVRTPEEFAQGHLPGAVLIPHDQL